MKLINEVTKEKIRGGFYTPLDIAKFILQWSLDGTPNASILEPSCGDGVFLESLGLINIDYKKVTGVELDNEESVKARNLNVKKSEVINTDFLDFYANTTEKYDVIVGNPPYIRYQFLDKEQKERSEIILKTAGIKHSSLMNSWVPFVIGSALLLSDKGKMGFVLPAELLQVSYAAPVREFLSHYFSKVTLITFKKLVFEAVQQEVVIMLCEKGNDEKHGIQHIELNDASELEPNKILLNGKKSFLDFTNKWTYYFLDKIEIDFLNKITNQESLKRIGDCCKVEVGITTGANDFFTVSKEVVDKYKLAEWVKPMVGRSVQVDSVIFNQEDWQKNIEKGAKAYLLDFSKFRESMDFDSAKEYIKYGESLGIEKGYKNRIRENWFVVPSIWKPDAFFLRRNNILTKFTINEANAYSTDTMHRVKIKEGYNIKAVVASFYTSLSFAFAEILGRSYGGGVLEILPSEVESIYIPYREDNSKLLDTLDKKMRQGGSLDEIFTITDREILMDKFGFSDKDVSIANGIWKKLLARRLNRK